MSESKEKSLLNAVMNPVVKSVTPETPIREVVRAMRDMRHSCMVVARHNIPVGIITERDMVRILSDTLAHEAATKEMCAADYMSTPPIVMKQSASLFEALVIARARGIRHLPVVDEHDELCGIITQTDIMRAHLILIEQQRAHIETLVNERTLELEKANERLRALSLEDGMLGIGNRRVMEVDLEHTHATSKRYKRPYSVVLFDIDYFKRYNDHYGHLAGDETLIQTSKLIQGRIRAADRLYRYGGDELLLLLPETPGKGALLMAERLVINLKALNIPHVANPHAYVTMSGGISSFQTNFTAQKDWRDIVLNADEALYQAKQSGRNQVKLALAPSQQGLMSMNKPR